MDGIMKQLSLFAAVAVLVAFMSGCTAVSEFKPEAPMIINSQLNRDNIEILDSVKGTSYSKAYCFYAVQSIDGKIVIFGIGLFDDKYAAIPGHINIGPSTLSRAYYDALTKHPEADYVIPKTYSRTGFSSFGFYEHTVVEVNGKAVKIKTDSELKK